MNTHFDGEILKERLDALPKWKRVAFGAMILSRALPNYLMFQVESGVLGGPNLLVASARIWKWLESEDEDWLSVVSPELCQSLAPDTELHGEAHVSSALDAACIAANILEFISRDQVDLIVECASLIHDSVYLYIGNKESALVSSDDFDVVVRNNPIVEKEVKCQLDDLSFLSEMNNDRSENWRLVLKRTVEKNYGALVLKD